MPLVTPSTVCDGRGRAGGRTRLAALAGTVGLAAALLVLPGLMTAVHATNFLDDFEGANESIRLSIRHLDNWTIIDSVDLTTERHVPRICRDTGSCVDLVGTAGLSTGGILSRASYPLATYLIGFTPYGSGRDHAGNETAAAGAVTRIQVRFGERSIYAHNNIPSDFAQRIILRVRGSGKLRFLAGGEVPNIGPVLDNVLVIQPGTVSGP